MVLALYIVLTLRCRINARIGGCLCRFRVVRLDMSEPADTEIRVLSFNCWCELWILCDCLRLTPAWGARGLKFVSKDRQLRFRAIAEELAESSYDVIALQEVWVRADYEIIRSKAARRLPHAKFFHAYVLVNI